MVNPGTAPSFTSAAQATFTTGVKKEFTVTATGSPLPALARSGTLPAGITFTDNGDGTATLAGTAAPAAAPPGSQSAYPLTFNATSAAGNAAQNFSLTVVNPGTAPSFTSAAQATFTTGVKKEFTVTATGSPLPALARSGTLPAGITFTDNGDGTATLAGTAAPAAAPPGSQSAYPLTFNATSAAGNAAQNFSLTVVNPGTAPSFTSAAQATFTTGVKKEFTVTATGSPLPALARSGTLPAGITFTDNGDGTATLAGTAAPAAAPPGSQSAYPLTFNATSAAGNAAQNFSLTVVNPESPSEPSPQQPVGGPTQSSPGDTSSPLLPALEAVPTIRLSRSTVRLPIGRSSRRLVKVLPGSESPISCDGTLPPGARCRITPRRDIAVEGSEVVKRAGVYRLSIDIADRDVRRQLTVRIARLDKRALDSTRPKGTQRP